MDLPGLAGNSKISIFRWRRKFLKRLHAACTAAHALLKSF
jgi:hypothetical protein